jgi:hypothetical protein
LNFIFNTDTIMRAVIGILLLGLTSVAATAQGTVPDKQGDGFEVTDAIEDNSFMLEEAFNQERNVIQHISVFTKQWDSDSWVYSFTQEWPFPGHERHQLSYTVPVGQFTEGPGIGAGVGDIALNYRYQVAGGGGQRFSFAPRLSVLLPTGSARFGRGAGGTGLQTNLPFSIYLNHKLVTHLNAGGTIVPNAQNSVGDTNFAKGWNLGQSFIYLAHPRFNFMLETIWTGAESVVARDRNQLNHTLLLSPGVRWAFNFQNGLQIVPGVAVPVGVGPSSGQKWLILYLSFEHPIGPTDPK